MSWLRNATVVTRYRPCSGPEVKGSAGYLTPTAVEWRVALGDRGLTVDAVVTGTGRKGTKSRGAVCYSLDGGFWPTPPDWLPVPYAWIADASDHVRAYQSGDQDD